MRCSSSVDLRPDALTVDVWTEFISPETVDSRIWPVTAAIADAVEPLGIEGREITRTYTQSTPLNRFVDAARGDSAAVRRAESEAAKVIAGNPDAELERTFRAWRENHARLGPHFAGNALLNEAAGVSRDLSRIGEIGLQALARLRNRQSSADWATASLTELDRLGKPQIEVVLAAVRPVRQLLLTLQRGR